MRRPRSSAVRAALVTALAAAALCAPACGRGGSPAAGARQDETPQTILLSEAERAGEAIYRRENCARCHTLLDRPSAVEAIEPPGVRDSDAPPGRVGPDLGLEGHRRSDEWHYAHLYAPAALVPGSPMPASRHLFVPRGGRPEPAREAIDLVAYLQALGRARRDIWAERRARDPAITPPPAADAALLRRGEELYERHCGACHGDRGDGRGSLAELFTFPPRDFTQGLYRFKSTPYGRPPFDSDLFRTITLGAGTGAAMPSFDGLPPLDRWALVLRIKEFSPVLRGTGLHLESGTSGFAASAKGAGDLAAGRKVWDGLGCAACHGPAGAGMTAKEAGTDWKDAAGVPVPRSGDLTHACGLRGGASREALARAVLMGVEPAMPSYAEALSDHDHFQDLLVFLRSQLAGQSDSERVEKGLDTATGQ